MANKNIKPQHKSSQHEKAKTSILKPRQIWQIKIFSILELGGIPEPHLKITCLIWSPRYYGHFFLSRRKAHTFFNTKTPLTRPPRFTANSEIPTCIILYKLPHHTATRTSCVHLCIVHISYTDSSLNF